MKLETKIPPHVWVCGRWRRYNIEDPAITQLSPARRQRAQELGKFGHIFEVRFLPRLATDFRQLLYSYMIV